MKPMRKKNSPNKCIGNDIITGTFFITGGDGGEELISLNEEHT